MSRRWRIRLTWLLVILGVPVALVCLAVFLMTSGRLEQVISAQYASIFPGHLSIGRVAVLGPDEFLITDMQIGEGLHRPLVICARATAKADIFNGKLLSLKLEGVQGYLDEDNFHLLQRIIKASDLIPPTVPPVEWALDAEGAVDFPTESRITGAYARGRIVGPLFDLDCGCRLDGRPVRVRVSSKALAAEANRIHIQLTDAVVEPSKALATITALGMLPPTPPLIGDRLPLLMDVSGSLITRDTAEFRFGADATLRWITTPERGGGTLNARLDADRHRVTITQIRYDDQDLGSIGMRPGDPTGTLVIDQDRENVTLTADAWRPGPKLGLPPNLPVDAGLRILPRLNLVNAWKAGSTRIGLTGAGVSHSRLDLERTGDGPLVLTAQELPLQLLQNSIPEEVTLTGGQITDLNARFQMLHGFSQATLQQVTLQAVQARASTFGWSFGPVDGKLILDPTPDGMVAQATLPMGTLRWESRPQATGIHGTITTELDAIEALLARVHAPMTLPELQGKVAATVTYGPAGETGGRGQQQATFERLDLRGVAIRARPAAQQAGDSSLSTLQGVSADLRGQLRWGGDQPLRIKLGGQLRSGRIRLPGTWLDLATRTPIFTAGLAIEGPGRGVSLDELLVRAAQPGGKPVTDSYSAQFSGTVDGDGNGTIKGLVDHADLAWVEHAVAKSGVDLAGQGAITCTTTFKSGDIDTVEGHFLPLDADLAIGKRFRATGITGAIHFLMERPVSERPGK